MKWFPAVEVQLVTDQKDKSLLQLCFCPPCRAAQFPFLLFLLINYRRSEQTSLRQYAQK